MVTHNVEPLEEGGFSTIIYTLYLYGPYRPYRPTAYLAARQGKNRPVCNLAAPGESGLGHLHSISLRG